MKQLLCFPMNCIWSSIRICEGLKFILKSYYVGLKVNFISELAISKTGRQYFAIKFIECFPLYLAIHCCCKSTALIGNGDWLPVFRWQWWLTLQKCSNVELKMVYRIHSSIVVEGLGLLKIRNTKIALCSVTWSFLS